MPELMRRGLPVPTMASKLTICVNDQMKILVDVALFLVLTSFDPSQRLLPHEARVVRPVVWDIRGLISRYKEGEDVDLNVIGEISRILRLL